MPQAQDPVDEVGQLADSPSVMTTSTQRGVVWGLPIQEPRDAHSAPCARPYTALQRSYADTVALEFMSGRVPGDEWDRTVPADAAAQMCALGWHQANRQQDRRGHTARAVAKGAGNGEGERCGQGFGRDDRRADRGGRYGPAAGRGRRR